MSVLLLSALVLGLTSNLHCLGMCGPIAIMIPVKRTSTWQAVWGTLQYHFGRIAIYALMGAIVGMLGVTLRFVGWLQWMSILTGILLILFAWRKVIAVRWKLPVSGLFRWIHGLRTWGMKTSSPFRLTVLGAVNGLLPCGMVYVALVNAAITGDVFFGGLSMLLFGIGTLPILVFVGVSGSRLKSFRKWSSIAPYAITVLGLLIVLRGLNLGIPFVSPKVQLPAQHETSEAVTAHEESGTMSCCHGKTSSTCEKPQ